ncbi:unnamed protein product [Nyctereutes procyonoides]|uniref:(raccoon dog) hypothetical protein n=1 Tax=Nyctereutes procyonoides TaxID=34880 RepID=A0A811ZHM7_NYCPR|nr:unnamed protein product [Nyctereutes procyonoides]CAD7688219.1 unnamed protein product [Nyctereutes procyonoides]
MVSTSAQGICSGFSFCFSLGWKAYIIRVLQRAVFVSLGCHNKVPQMGGLNNRNLLSHAHHLGTLLKCRLLVHTSCRKGLWDDSPWRYSGSVTLFNPPLKRKNVREPEAHHIWTKTSRQALSHQSHDSYCVCFMLDSQFLGADNISYSCISTPIIACRHNRCLINTNLMKTMNKKCTHCVDFKLPWFYFEPVFKKKTEFLGHICQVSPSSSLCPSSCSIFPMIDKGTTTNSKSPQCNCIHQGKKVREKTHASFPQESRCGTLMV